MSAKLVTKRVYRCVCELPDCPGQGKPWYSKTDTIPPRCNWCARYTWNGVDKRRADTKSTSARTKQA